MPAIDRNLWRTIAGSTAGTLIEWYDFFLYGALTSLLAKVFFSNLSPSTAYLFSLLTFAAGFLVRPLGAVIFGVIGDRWGRKNTFLVSMVLMGVSTIAIGFLPDYHTIGIYAPALLLTTRLIQGLAVGGEYGGAATFIAEHSPPTQRGYATSFVQLTCTLGLALALAAVIAARAFFSPMDFETWGWRVPFIASVVLLFVAYWIRRRLDESPLFKQRIEEGTLSKSPLQDSFNSPGRIGKFLLATFCMTGGMTVIFYTSQFYVLTFMTKSALLSDQSASIILLIGLLLAIPAFPIVGWLSDRVGRKPIILAGFVLAGLTYFPIFMGLGHSLNSQLFNRAAIRDVILTVNKNECSAQFNLIAPARPKTFCDTARIALASRSVPYSVVASSSASESLKVGTELVTPEMPFDAAKADANIRSSVTAAGFAPKAQEKSVDWIISIGLIWLMVVYVALAYSPLAAALAEMFPTEIRYTSLSFSYNLSVGWIGGLLPSIAFAIVVATGHIFAGLWYPVSVTLAAAVLTLLFMKDRKGIGIR